MSVAGVLTERVKPLSHLRDFLTNLATNNDPDAIWYLFLDIVTESWNFKIFCTCPKKSWTSRTVSSIVKWSGYVLIWLQSGTVVMQSCCNPLITTASLPEKKKKSVAIPSRCAVVFKFGKVWNWLYKCADSEYCTVFLYLAPSTIVFLSPSLDIAHFNPRQHDCIALISVLQFHYLVKVLYSNSFLLPCGSSPSPFLFQYWVSLNERIILNQNVSYTMVNVLGIGIR